MQNLKKLLKTPLLPLPNKLIIAIVLLALIGFADATYLTIEHYSGVIPPCTVGGCEQVLTSEYSIIWGIPLALGGAFYYLIILVGSLIYFESKKELYIRTTLALTIIGFLMSLYLFYLQAIVIKAFCFYCLGSAATSTALFALTIYVFAKYRINQQDVV